MQSKILLQNAYPAGADLSAATRQFSIVKLNSSGQVVPVAAADDKPVGVLLNSPTSGQVAEVAMLGETKLRVGGTDIALDTLVGCGTDGRAVSVASGNFICGRVESIYAADNDGAIVTATINFLSLARAALTGG